MKVTISGQTENPNGLYHRYNITKASGEPCDTDAVYFVLRLDSGGDDQKHIAACRAALQTYTAVMEAADHLPKMADDLRTLLWSLDKDTRSYFQRN